MFKSNEAIAFKYMWYTPIHISINVLLIPGTTTPIDIKKPDNIKNPVEK